jgi:drug/metabolite transporter (DMT)-like permease
MKQITRAGGIDISLLILTALIWASAFAAIKFALEDMGPVWTAASRVSIGFLALLPFAFVTKSSFRISRQELCMTVVIALLITVIPFILISWGLQHIDSGITALLMGTTPFMAMILGHFFTQDESINRYKLMAVAVGMSGIMLIVGPDAINNLGSTSFVAQLAIIGAGFCYVSGGILIRKVDMKPIPFTTLALGIGAFALLILAIALEGIPQQLPGSKATLALLWLGFFPTGLAYILRFYLVRKVGVSTFAIGMNTIPVFGIIFGAFLLNETVEIKTMIALGLVVSGLFIARLGSPKPDVKE